MHCKKLDPRVLIHMARNMVSWSTSASPGKNGLITYNVCRNCLVSQATIILLKRVCKNTERLRTVPTPIRTAPFRYCFHCYSMVISWHFAPPKVLRNELIKKCNSVYISVAKRPNTKFPVRLNPVYTITLS